MLDLYIKTDTQNIQENTKKETSQEKLDKSDIKIHYKSSTSKNSVLLTREETERRIRINNRYGYHKYVSSVQDKDCISNHPGKDGLFNNGAGTTIFGKQ